ncbi:MAG: type II toxin-antitoxin system YafQ family toxin [Patescibacteria group bacterium]
MYLIFPSRRYQRAHKRIKRHKDFNPTKLEEVVDALAQGKKLDPKYLDHELSGGLKSLRECHIQNDILLMYQIIGDKLVLVLVDIGSHSDLF